MENESNPKIAESNPIGSSLKFNVSIPKQIKVDLVDASTLSDYEIWIFIASVMSNFLVGFAVAWSQCPNNDTIVKVYKTVTTIFIVFLALSIIMVFIKRRKLKEERKQMNLGVKDIE